MQRARSEYRTQHQYYTAVHVIQVRAKWRLQEQQQHVCSIKATRQRRSTSVLLFKHKQTVESRHVLTPHRGVVQRLFLHFSLLLRATSKRASLPCGFSVYMLGVICTGDANASRRRRSVRLSCCEPIHPVFPLCLSALAPFRARRPLSALGPARRRREAECGLRIGGGPMGRSNLPAPSFGAGGLPRREGELPRSTNRCVVEKTAKRGATLFKLDPADSNFP